MKKKDDYLTKQDLENSLTKLESRLEEKLDKKLDLKLDYKFGQFRDEINDNLVKWKSEIFNLVDDLAEEIRDGRQHRQITSHQITDHEQRITTLEKTAAA